MYLKKYQALQWNLEIKRLEEQFKLDFTFVAYKEFYNLSTQVPDPTIYEEVGEDGTIEIKETQIHLFMDPLSY